MKPGEPHVLLHSQRINVGFHRSVAIFLNPSEVMMNTRFKCNCGYGVLGNCSLDMDLKMSLYQLMMMMSDGSISHAARN